jgi:hypothetical protein
MLRLTGLLLLLAAMLTLASPAIADAEQKSTMDMVRECQGRGPAGELGLLACASYLSGMMDLNAVLIGTKRLPNPVFCIPAAGISNEQAMLVFLKWATEHPEQLHETARMSMLISLSQAFPCQ